MHTIISYLHLPRRGEFLVRSFRSKSRAGLRNRPRVAPVLVTQRLLLSWGRCLSRVEAGGEAVVWSVAGRGNGGGLTSHRGQGVRYHPLHRLRPVMGHMTRVWCMCHITSHVSLPRYAGVIVTAHSGLGTKSSAVCLLPVYHCVSLHLGWPVNRGRGPDTALKWFRYFCKKFKVFFL